MSDAQHGPTPAECISVQLACGGFFGSDLQLWCAGFFVFACATLGVLMVMESLSAFLHALRLHWVSLLSPPSAKEIYTWWSPQPEDTGHSQTCLQPEPGAT